MHAPQAISEKWTDRTLTPTVLLAVLTEHSAARPKAAKRAPAQGMTQVELKFFSAY